MIRDPSDGSVREKREVDHQPKPLETGPYAPESCVLITTALAPAPKDEKEAARLEKARHWLKIYHERQDQARWKVPTGEAE